MSRLQEPAAAAAGGRSRRALGCAVAVALGLACGAQAADWGRWDADFDDEKKPWKELEARLPPAPAPASLLEFQASGASPHRYFLDAQSLSIGEDGVVRYTLVVRTGGGATNVSFEGIRCEERQLKHYASGKADGTWERARSPRWRRIELRESSAHHLALWRDYLCTGASNKVPVRTVADAVRALKHPPVLPHE